MQTIYNIPLVNLYLKKKKLISRFYIMHILGWVLIYLYLKKMCFQYSHVLLVFIILLVIL